ncbi:MAG: TetR/AcrR family transcriptional regulator [Cyanobacteria bacterium J06638_38]
MSQQTKKNEVAAAAWRVIVREGLSHTSMRAIAHELDCTTGVVTHYFRDKQELMLFALHQVTESLQCKMLEAAEKAEGIEKLRVMLCAFLPQDPERRQILQVWVAFLGSAVGQESLMAEHRQSATQLRELLVQELLALQSAQLIQAQIDPEIEANSLLALVNGIALDYLIQEKYLDCQQQEQVIRRYVNQLLSANSTSVSTK